MYPISNQALRAALDHETTSTVRQLQADNERLRNELARAKANLANRYLRSVLNLIDKHRELEFIGIDVLDNELTLYDDVDANNRHGMLNGLIDMPVTEKLKSHPGTMRARLFSSGIQAHVARLSVRSRLEHNGGAPPPSLPRFLHTWRHPASPD